jgi:hypothetical protein
MTLANPALQTSSTVFTVSPEPTTSPSPSRWSGTAEGQGEVGQPSRTGSGQGQNAVKHGLSSPQPVLRGIETEEEWQAYRAALLEDFKPVGALEYVLAERAILCQWRLRRISRYEVESTEAACHQAGLDADFSHFFAGAHTQLLQLTHSFPPPDAIDRVMRYEAHLTRQYTTATRELDKLQARRRTEATALARLDVSSPIPESTEQPPRAVGHHPESKSAFSPQTPSPAESSHPPAPSPHEVRPVNERPEEVEAQRVGPWALGWGCSDRINPPNEASAFSTPSEITKQIPPSEHVQEDTTPARLEVSGQ